MAYALLLMTLPDKAGNVPARREKVAPSMAALYNRPGLMLPGLRPVSTPEEWGQFGVRSPVM